MVVVCTGLLTQAVWGSEELQFSTQDIEFFEARIRPLLVEHCFDCHSTDAKKLQAQLYVDSREGLVKGGESGPAVVPGKADDSLLIQAVRYETSEMPPDQKLSDQQIKDLVRWVELGAPWPQVTSSPGVSMPAQEIDWERARTSHWAWQPVQRPDVPDAVESQPPVHHPIDRFVARRRHEAGLPAVPPAAAEILVRRVYIDLLGIPPTPEQTAAFVEASAVDRPAALKTLIDLLLDSPMYGQRWARHWLDVARYSDGHGGFLDNAALPEAWRFRDWVITAFNNDLPIDEFLAAQIAGDLTGDADKAIATGFFALGPTYRSDGGDPDSVAQAKGETLDDRIDTLTRGLLGITGSCARCHDHKFDPIPQQDYYSLAGVFNNTGVRNYPLAAADVVQRADEHRRATADFQKRIKDLETRLGKEKRDATADEATQLADWKTQLDQLNQNVPPGYATAHALHDTGSADMKVAIRGNLRKEGETAPRRFLRILSPGEPANLTKGSGRQQLADAIVSPANPLTVRVFVNRVWMHHFGKALVRTPSNFGTLGELPSHPELLDWLSSEFTANGWSLKELHRLMMTSETYQLSSRFDAKAFATDGANRLLWRMSPRRMDVEAWRDSLLSVTGELDAVAGGPPFDNIMTSKRRTVYAKVSRNGDQFASDLFLRRFDFPIMRATVAKRPASVVPQQYLFLLNSSFMIDRAKALAHQMQRDYDRDPSRIDAVYRLLFGREPMEQERDLASGFLNPLSAASDSAGVEQNNVALDPWVQYAQVLLSSNEFMFVR